MEQEARNRIVRIKRVDEDKRIVYAEVYAPYVLDTYGEFMVPEDIETMAHRFMCLDLREVIDTNHDNVPNGSFPVESFIARDNDPDFTEGAWVLGVKIVSDEVWDKIVRGDLNGYSFEAMVKLVEYDLDVQVVRDHFGETATLRGVDHEHMFFVQVNEKGRVVRGYTSEGPDGHVHDIKHGTATEKAGADNHAHRFELGVVMGA
jgi:hypothetical protein